MKLEQYIIFCPWCECEMTLDNAEYYCKLNTHKIICKCITCQSQWVDGK